MDALARWACAFGIAVVGGACAAVLAAAAAPSSSLSAMALHRGDLPGSRVVLEERSSDPGELAGFEREFVGGRIGSTSLSHWESDVTLAGSSAQAAQLLSSETRMATLANRAVIVHLFNDAIGDDLGGRGEIVSLRLARARALAAGDGASELVLAVRVRGTQYAQGAADFQFAVAFARTGPVVGMLLLLSEPGGSLAPDDVSALAGLFVGRMRGGLG